MAFTLNTKSFTQDTYLNSNKVLYTGPDNTFGKEDSFTLGRTAPKSTPNNAGVGRTESRRCKYVECAGGVYKPAVITTTSSIPADIVNISDVDSLRDDMGDWLLSTDAQNLMNKHDINV